jgi:hypothetical protein
VFNSRETPRHQRMLEGELERAIGCLKLIPSMDQQEYSSTLKTTERLYEMMEKDKSSSVSKDVALTVVANLLGIFMIIKHEHVNVITSKALGFVFRLR